MSKYLNVNSPIGDEVHSQTGTPRHAHLAAIAMGSNLGDSYSILRSALAVISETPNISLQAQSSIYRTVAVGPPQPDYLNACIIISTALDPEALLDRLLEIEAQFGRVRHERWGPRLLDLDLLLFDDLVVRLPQLTVPHPRMSERAFVLVPLNDVAPHWVEPISGKAIAELVQQVDCSGVDRLYVND
ncbi:MAG: 2-amino-4-hydroxy-6-hydroxymethyldihydropteridine diphosphokinase [Elainellaceae cyanobacterium]